MRDDNDALTLATLFRLIESHSIGFRHKVDESCVNPIFFPYSRPPFVADPGRDDTG
jgi:hypothetical protein